MRWLLLCGLLAGASVARAEMPATGGGRIDVGAGWRFLPSRSGLGVQTRFAWQANPNILVGVAIGLQGYDQKEAEGNARVLAGKVRLEAGYQLELSEQLYPYLSFGFGYDLISAKTSQGYDESGATGVSLAAGLTFVLTKRLGLVVEDRFDFAQAPLTVFGTQEKVQGGGNLVWVGLSISFDPEPENTGH